MIDLSLFKNPDFDRGAPRWKEGLWVLTRGLLFMHAIPLPSSWKVGALRAFGATVGTGVIMRSRINITFPWRITIGDHVWIGDEVSILSLAQVTIGSNVCLSQRAFVCTGTHDFESTSFSLVTNPIIIGDRSWIAGMAFISPGVTIGSDSLVAAGSVVTRDVEANTKVAGNPARAI